MTTFFTGKMKDYLLGSTEEFNKTERKLSLKQREQLRGYQNEQLRDRRGASSVKNGEEYSEPEDFGAVAPI